MNTADKISTALHGDASQHKEPSSSGRDDRCTITRPCSACYSVQEVVDEGTTALADIFIKCMDGSSEARTDEWVRSDLAENLSFEGGSGGNITQSHEDSASAIIAIAPQGMLIHGCGGVMYRKVGANQWVEIDYVKEYT